MPILQNKNNLYLHFFDRELRESVSATINEETMLLAILSSICLVPGTIFCSYSHLWESYDLLQGTLNILKNIIKPASSDYSSEEFLENHQRLYQHDKKRYPLYFKNSGHKIIYSIKPNVPLSYGATSSLEENFNSLSSDHNTLKNHEMNALIKDVLSKRGDLAITFSLFCKHSNKNAILANIRRKISEFYTRHYLDACNADILTGIPNLKYYDRLSTSMPRYDFEIFQFLFWSLFRFDKTPVALAKLIETIFKNRDMQEYNIFIEFYTLATEKILSISTWHNGQSLESLRGDFFAILRKILGEIKIPKSNIFTFEHFNLLLFNIIEYIKKNYKQTNFNSLACIEHKIILFVLVTDSEFQAAKTIFPEFGLNINERIISYDEAWETGTINGYNIILIRSKMGSIGVGGSSFVIYDAIQKFTPKYVIMTGIAFGLRKDKQSMCDILVSESISDYETSKIYPEKIIHRGHKIQAAQSLLLKAEQLSKERKDIHFGEILAGCKIVNDETFTKNLISHYPNAIGGEMEGAGLASACARKDVPWILIKSICDWGSEKGDDYQFKAALKSIRFCLNIVKELV